MKPIELTEEEKKQREKLNEIFKNRKPSKQFDDIWIPEYFPEDNIYSE